MLMVEQEPGSSQEAAPEGKVPVTGLRRAGHVFAWLGKMIWKGKVEEPPAHVWTAEEYAQTWAKGEIPPPEFPDTRFGRFDRRWTEFTKWWSYLAGVGLLLVVVVLVADVIGWKFFKHPFPSATDIVKNMNVVAVFFAVAYIQTDRGSTGIELFQKRFPRYLKVGIRTFAWILGMAACFYCAYRGFYKVHGQLVHIEKSDPPLRFLIWPFGAAMVIGFILLGLSFVVSGIRDIVEFKERRARYGPRPPKAPKRAKKTGSASAAPE